MSGSANVNSIEVIRKFRAAMIEYDEDIRDALTMLQLEVRRAQDWIENDRALYWPEQVRNAGNAVVEARNALERCELELRPEEKRSCIDEKRKLERAKRRMRLCEEKVRVAKSWRIKFKQELDEFVASITKTSSFLEFDLPRAIALLERMSKALDRYTAAQAPPTGDTLQQAKMELKTPSERGKGGS
ncbi:MAG: hypothetical protein QGG36_06795 [Pirellulaceae bacterium]|jgi:hypothetical protein|nr:hypothetical protein [Pirellulaceae bacterium]MDP7015488.1 hypothetical protein [Pirellulaceae bacterium]